MLATRKFWFQPPVKYDPEWTDYLEQYKAQAQPWPHVPPPGAEDLIRTVLATNDSSPGPDGIPYAAWRLHPGVSSDAMITHLNDICRSSVPPPCSVQAWIPKAKMGPTADNFRPLGMPSTFERVIDGSIATVMTRAIAPLLHPSQTVLNLFRELQSAVQSVQSVLDQDAPCTCLSLDLSKAFERINPYWILQILSACKAPWWIIMYTRHILLFRRCRHKVQGKLLPSKMIVTGVDMGRSFSVLLFCVAMDLVLTYLNRIPGMLAVQGYADDITMVGDTIAGMQWLSDAWQVCTRLRSAGIQIDEHHCWRTSGINMHAASSGQIDQYPPLQWTLRLQGHATLRQALVHRAGYSTTTIVCRAKLFVCLTPAEVDVVLAGGHLAKIDPLFLIQCSCLTMQWSTMGGFMQELSLLVIDEGQQYGTDREIAVISLLRQQPLVLWTGDSEQTPGGIDRAARNAKRSRQLLLSKKHGLRSDRNYYMPAHLADAIGPSHHATHI